MTSQMTIQQARKAKKLTQAQAAAAIGVSQQTWAEHESGRGNPTLSTLRRMAGVVGAKPVMELARQVITGR